METTYFWNGDNEVVLSGYPGRRDWVANMAANPTVTLHTVEFEPWFDIPGRARVLWNTNDRLPHIFNFIDRWAERPGFPRRRFAFALGAIKLNRRLGLPWWGPFWFARKVLDNMPCVVVTFAGPPALRPHGPPLPLRTATPLAPSPLFTLATPGLRSLSSALWNNCITLFVYRSVGTIASHSGR